MTTFNQWFKKNSVKTSDSEFNRLFRNSSREIWEAAQKAQKETDAKLVEDTRFDRCDHFAELIRNQYQEKLNE